MILVAVEAIDLYTPQAGPHLVSTPDSQTVTPSPELVRSVPDSIARKSARRSAAHRIPTAPFTVTRTVLYEHTRIKRDLQAPEAIIVKPHTVPSKKGYRLGKPVTIDRAREIAEIHRQLTLESIKSVKAVGAEIPRVSLSPVAEYVERPLESPDLPPYTPFFQD